MKLTAAEFEKMVPQFHPMVERTARRMLRNPEDAKDAAQEVFLRAFSRHHTFRGDSKFSTWLMRITINTCLMRLRRHTPEVLSLNAPENGEFYGATFAERVECAEDTPEQHLQRLELRAALERAVKKLRPSQRIVVILRDVRELDTRQTGEALGIHQSAIKSRLLRGRAALKRQLMAAGVTTPFLISRDNTRKGI